MEARMLGTLALAASTLMIAAGCAAAPKLAAPAGPGPMERAAPAEASAPVANEAAEAPAIPPAANESEGTFAGAPPPPAAANYLTIREGAWRIGGSTNAIFSNQSAGPVDATSFGLEASLGKMITSNVLLEGIFDLSTTNTDVDGGPDSSQTEFQIGGGARYYFDVQGSTHPYLRALLGLEFIDLEVGNASNDDTSIFIGLGAGAETFLTEALALDYGFRFIHAFDVFDDSLTDISLFAGLSFWM